MPERQRDAAQKDEGVSDPEGGVTPRHRVKLRTVCRNGLYVFPVMVALSTRCQRDGEKRGERWMVVSKEERGEEHVSRGWRERSGAVGRRRVPNSLVEKMSALFLR